jgi:hypothetical protein
MKGGEIVAAVLRQLPGPYEVLDLQDRGSITLRLVSWERGTMIIHPRGPGAPEEKEIDIIRLHLAAGVKATPPNYYDVTSKTLQAQLLPMVLEREFERYEYIITKYGVAPRARFTVERRPL